MTIHTRQKNQTDSNNVWPTAIIDDLKIISSKSASFIIVMFDSTVNNATQYTFLVL